MNIRNSESVRMIHLFFLEPEIGNSENEPLPAQFAMRIILRVLWRFWTILSAKNVDDKNFRLGIIK